jgi:hypothetical protein
MQFKLLQWINRLETLSARERAMALLGAPLVLVMAGELLVFAPARSQAADATKQAERQQTELKSLSATLAAIPVAAPLPGADQLLRQRNELQGQIDAARAITGDAAQAVDWGTVVRATATGTPGLTLTQLKTMPAEVVFSPSMVKPPTGAASRPAPPPQQLAGDTIYRHRAELTVKGNVSALLGYLQTLQHVPGDLRWERLQLSVVAYPQASVQLNLQTLSNRAETPFN